jgi:hypothetical protein
MTPQIDELKNNSDDKHVLHMLHIFLMVISQR